MYPHCLEFLRLLQDSKFRDNIQNNPPTFINFIEFQQHNHWSFYKQKILRNYENYDTYEMVVGEEGKNNEDEEENMVDNQENNENDLEDQENNLENIDENENQMNFEDFDMNEF